MMTAGNDQQFATLCAVIGQPGLAEDPKYKTNRARVQHRKEIVATLEAAFRTAPRHVWAERLNAAGVPCAPVNTIEEAFANPQVVARGTRVDIPDPVLGQVSTVASPLRFSETPSNTAGRPPVSASTRARFWRNGWAWLPRRSKCCAVRARSDGGAEMPARTIGAILASALRACRRLVEAMLSFPCFNQETYA